MNEVDECANWFRLGIKYGLDKSFTDPLSSYDEEAEPWLKWSFDAGVKVGEQMLCEKTGHDDKVREWHNLDGAKARYAHELSRECRKCDRVKTTIIASFDTMEEWDAYSRGLIAEKKRKDVR